LAWIGAMPPVSDIATAKMMRIPTTLKALCRIVTQATPFKPPNT